MSPEQLLQKLSDLGIVDSRYLDKIRAQVENPERVVKPKAVLGYLVKKGQITEKQAAKLLKAKPPEDEIAVVVPQEANHDTNDLMALADDEPKSPGTGLVPVDRGATMDVGALDAGQDDGEIIEVQPVASEKLDPVLLDEPVQPDPIAAGGLLDGGFDQGGYDQGGFESGAYAQQDADKPKLGFAGKRNQTDQWSTKWLYIGFGILGTVLILSAVLWLANLGQKPEDMFEAASSSYNNQSWGDATKKFEEYLDAYPNHKDSKTARALKVNSILRSTYGMKNWPEVIQQANTLLPPLNEEEGNKMDQIREDLGVMLPRCLVEISNESKKNNDLAAMQTELETINEYKAVIENPVYIPNSIRKTPSIADNYAKIENNIRTIQGQINKEKLYNSSLVDIEKLRQEGKTDDAYVVFRKLTRQYGDLAGRTKLRELMLTISDKERELVSAITPEIAVANQPRPSVVQSSVLMAAKSGEPVDSLKGEIVNFLADGSVYGIEAGEGNIAWRHFVGFQTNVQPVPVGDQFLALSNQKDNEILVVDRETGKIKWRAGIGEPFMSPSVGERFMIVTTESGKVIQLNSETGELVQATKIPQRTANCNAMIAPREPYIYQPGFYSNIYVLSQQDLSCKEVFHLGHYEGSISVRPEPWFGHILVAVNGGDYCDLHVLRPKKNGLGLELIQSFSRITSGPVSSPFQRFGRLMLLASDNGEMRILEANPTDLENPVQIFANDLFETRGGQESFFLTEGSNLWVAGKGIIRYRIRRNEGKFAREVIAEGTDTFLGEVHKLDDYVMHVRRRYRSGMLSATLADAKTLKPIWRTDFGGQLAGPPAKFGSNIVAVTNQGDMFQINQQTEETGYTDQAVRSSTIVQDLKFKELIPVGNDSFACVGPADRKDLLYARGTTGESKLMTLAQPADKPACRPMPLGEYLIVPSTSGQIARVDPKNGRTVGAPFQPPITPGTVMPWYEPTKVSENVFAIAVGVNESVTDSVLYLLDGSNKRSFKEVASLPSEQPFKSRLVSDGKTIFGVIEAEDENKLVAIPSSAPLKISGELKLDGTVVGGPWLTKAGIVMKLDNDQLVCVNADLTPKWSVPIGNVKLATEPQVIGPQLMVTLQTGDFKMLNPSSGETINQFSVGQPINHRPLIVQQKMYVGGMDGTLHVVDLRRLSQ